MNNNEDRKWYVLYTMPQHEKKIAIYLTKQGIEYYLPLIKRKRKWSDRIKIIDFPLFPGYIFLYISYTGEHLRALQYPGALAFVRKKGAPADIAEETINSLKIMVERSKDVRSEIDDNFPPGQEVQVRFGPLKGVTGVVVRIKNKSRLYIRVPLLNRMVSAEVDIIDVEKVY